MKRFFLILLAGMFCLPLVAQNKLVLKNGKDSASIVLTDSSLFLSVDGRTSFVMPENKTIYLTGSARAWDDLRVPVTSTTAAGSSPPTFSFFKNSGGKYIGKARRYDGMDDYDSIPTIKSLNFASTDLSIAFWIVPEPGMLSDAKILYKKGGWNVAVQGDKVRVYLEGKGVLLSSRQLNMGTRNLVVINVRNTSMRTDLSMLINNQQAGKQSWSSSLTDVTAPVLVGKAESKGFGNSFKGTLDALMFWKKSLSIQECDSLWNGSKGTETLIAKSSLVLAFDYNVFGFPVSTIGGVEVKSYTGDPATAATAVVGLISETVISHGVFAYYFDGSIVQELFFTAQLPHSWAEGTEIEPHVHYYRPDSDTGTVVWGLEFTWCNMNEVYQDTRVIYAHDKGIAVSPNTQIYASFGMVDGKGRKISSMMVCRIFRAADDPRDTYEHEVGLLEIDFHILNSSLGSSGMLK